jgi:rare lipoprotein A (peptidoglycan hydrolase)
MKAKTKRRVIHVLTKKKLVKRKTSKAVLRSFVIGLATISMGSLAYAVTMNRPNVNVAVHSSSAGGVQIEAPVVAVAPTPTPATAGGAAQNGRASWYALGLPAPDAFTCASRTFPRGTYLQVTDLYNQRTMVCLVNDYGPEAWTGRILDLSRGSFRRVDDLGRGTIPIEIRVATGPTGINLPTGTDDFAALVGYSLCEETSSPQYCDQHRQD